jgi:hypothetical protein
VTEAELQAEIRLAVGKVPHSRLFRNATGDAWSGEVVRRTPQSVTLSSPRYIKMGLVPGSADLIGFTTVTVTPEMVGTKVAVFTSGEVKPKRSARFQPGQENWRDAIQAAGGFADILYSVDDALKLVRA